MIAQKACGHALNISPKVGQVVLAVALEKGGAKLIFKLFQGHGNCRLGAKQAVSRISNVTEFSNGGKNPQCFGSDHHAMPVQED
jgi:hypothetical protein